MARRSQRIQEKNSVPNKPPVNATKLNSSRKRTRSKEDDISEAEVQQIPRKRAKKSSPKAASLEDDAPSEDDVAVAEKKRRVPEQYRKVRGKFALLERLVQDVPLEVILEIFCYLEPGDLLRLARTSKDLRGILMSKSSEDIWRTARGNVKGLPPRPEDLNEPQYARLLEDAYCYTCQHKGRCDNVLWKFRARVCKSCVESKILPSYDDDYLVKQPLEYRYLLPSERVSVGNTCVRIASNKITAKYRAEFEALQTEEERKAWVEHKRKERKAIEEHAQLCKSWHQKQLSARRIVLDDIRRKRKKDILDRLEELGWREEAEIMDKEWTRGWFYRLEVNGFRDNKFVNQPKKLTDKAWEANKADLVDILKKHKKARLVKEKEDRKRAAERERVKAAKNLNPMAADALARAGILPTQN